MSLNAISMVQMINAYRSLIGITWHGWKVIFKLILRN